MVPNQALFNSIKVHIKIEVNLVDAKVWFFKQPRQITEQPICESKVKILGLLYLDFKILKSCEDNECLAPSIQDNFQDLGLTDAGILVHRHIKVGFPANFSDL